MRSVQNQMAWCTRAQWTMSVLMFSLGVLFYVFGYRPATIRQAQLAQAISSGTLKLGTNQSRASSLPYLGREVATLEAKVLKFNKKLPKTMELGEFIREMTQLSQQYNLRKLIHQPGQVKRQDMYSEVPITMNFEGDFNRVFDFLRQMEEMQRLARVKTLTLRSRDGKLGNVDVNMAMNIYFSEY